MKRPTLKVRILTAVAEADGTTGYHALMYKLWPRDQFPRAFRHSANGGPPGVAMTFGRALEELRAEGMIFRGSYHDRRGRYVGQPDIHLTRAGEKAAGGIRSA